jgi:replicative DNA helicase
VQMNREIEKGGRDEDGFLKRLPQTSDLRDAGEIEEQASKVIFTHNKNQLVLRKNRFGVSEAEIACTFVGEKTRWGTR